MIKIAGHIILSLMLLISTTGLAVSKHYCGGELISTSLFVEADSCCDMGDSDGCCKNETKVFQLEEDFSSSSTTVIPESIQINLLLISCMLFNLNLDESLEINEFEQADSPPTPKIQTSLAKRQTYLL